MKRGEIQMQLGLGRDPVRPRLAHLDRIPMYVRVIVLFSGFTTLLNAIRIVVVHDAPWHFPWLHCAFLGAWQCTPMHRRFRYKIDPPNFILSWHGSFRLRPLTSHRLFRFLAFSRVKTTAVIDSLDNTSRY
jgi:hypothetical protein